MGSMRIFGTAWDLMHTWGRETGDTPDLALYFKFKQVHDFQSMGFWDTLCLDKPK